MAGSLIFSKINKEDDQTLLDKERKGIAPSLLGTDRINVSYATGDAPLSEFPDVIKAPSASDLSKLAPIKDQPKKPSLK